MPDRRGQVRVGDPVPARQLTTIHGEYVRVPAADRLVHLQFRRYAGCPVCNLHLHSVVRRHDEITAAGVTEVVFFHSTVESLLQYQDQLPLAVVADPDRQTYREFGVEASPRSVVDPRAWPAVARGIVAARSLRGALDRSEQHLGLPADILVDPHGRVFACKYGSHADDQWTVDELLVHAARSRSAS